MIKFDGDHNSSRPQFYYDSVTIFFYNVLHPPQLAPAHSCKGEKYYDLGDLKVSADPDEVISTHCIVVILFSCALCVIHVCILFLLGWQRRHDIMGVHYY